MGQGFLFREEKEQERLHRRMTDLDDPGATQVLLHVGLFAE